MANKSYPKPQNMLCGSACLFYLATQVFNIPCDDLPNDYMWITDIASYVIRHFDKRARLSCFESNLYNDYKKANFNMIPCFEGFKKVDAFLKSGKEIEEKEISEKVIDDLLKRYRIVLLNVSSAVFNQDVKMRGGHYIIIIGEKDDEYLIVNPGKTSITEHWYPKEIILDAATCFGSWMITILNYKKR